MNQKDIDPKIASLIVLTVAVVAVAVVFYGQSELVFQVPSLSSPEGIIFWFFGIILIFLICRELVTWYWKINRIVKLLEKIEENTRPTDREDQI